MRQAVHSLNRDQRDIQERLRELLDGVRISPAQPLCTKGGGLWLTAEPMRQADGEAAILMRILSTWDDPIVLEGCRLALIDNRGEESAKGTLDAQGAVRFVNVPPGEYQVTIQEPVTTAQCLQDNRLIAYLSEWLSADRKQAVVTHLGICQRCRVRLDQLREAMKEQTTWPLSELLQAAGEGVPKAVSDFRHAKRWLQELLGTAGVVRVRGGVPTLGAVRTRGARRVLARGGGAAIPVRAQVVDHTGAPTGRTVVLEIAQEPEVDAQGQFRCMLRTPETGFEGYLVKLAITREGKRLELCAVPLQKRREEEGLRASSPIAALGPPGVLREEGRKEEGLVAELTANLGEMGIKGESIPMDVLEFRVCEPA